MPLPPLNICLDISLTAHPSLAPVKCLLPCFPYCLACFFSLHDSWLGRDPSVPCSRVCPSEDRGRRGSRGDSETHSSHLDQCGTQVLLFQVYAFTLSGCLLEFPQHISCKNSANHCRRDKPELHPAVDSLVWNGFESFLKYTFHADVFSRAGRERPGGGEVEREPRKGVQGRCQWTGTLQSGLGLRPPTHLHPPLSDFLRNMYWPFTMH